MTEQFGWNQAGGSVRRLRGADMGWDIRIRQGVAVPEAYLLELIGQDNCEVAKRCIVGFIAEMTEQVNHLEAEMEQDRYSYEECLRRAQILSLRFSGLSPETAATELRSMLQSLTMKDEGVDEYTARDLAVRLWGKVIQCIIPDAPAPQDWEYVDSVSPLTVLIGEIERDEMLYVFDERDCVRCIDTAAGAAINGIIGKQRTVSVWTDFDAGKVSLGGF